MEKIKISMEKIGFSGKKMKRSGERRYPRKSGPTLPQAGVRGGVRRPGVPDGYFIEKNRAIV
ncbi:MAG: hypothetical protein LBG42_00150 [Treponema sp.]|nr:hypothetical protein [Treponema sp.]